MASFECILKFEIFFLYQRVFDKEKTKAVCNTELNRLKIILGVGCLLNIR